MIDLGYDFKRKCVKKNGTEDRSGQDSLERILTERSNLDRHEAYLACHDKNYFNVISVVVTKPTIFDVDRYLAHIRPLIEQGAENESH